MALLEGQNKKRGEPTLGQRYGTAVRSVVDGVDSNVDNAIMRPLAAIDRGVAASQSAIGSGFRDASASYTAGRPTSAPVAPPSAKPVPVRNPIASTVGGGSGGFPASPVVPKAQPVQAPVAAPPARRAMTNTSAAAIPYKTGDGRQGLLPPGVAVVPVRNKDGTTSNAFAASANSISRATGANAVAAPPVQAPPSFTTPSISPVGGIGVTNRTEDRGQREAREAAVSEIGTQLFLNRDKTTRSARDLTSDLLRTQADLTNTAGNQAVSMKNANLDAQTRADLLTTQQQGENDRAVLGQLGDNERWAYHDAGEAARERIKLERPTTITDREGGYLLVDQMTGVARPVLSGGQQVRGLVEGAITPLARLESLQQELSASYGSLTPNPERNGELERQVDALRRPATGPLPGDVVKGYRFRGGDPSIEANWEPLAQGGAP